MFKRLRKQNYPSRNILQFSSMILSYLDTKMISRQVQGQFILKCIAMILNTTVYKISLMVMFFEWY